MKIRTEKKTSPPASVPSLEKKETRLRDKMGIEDPFEEEMINSNPYLLSLVNPARFVSGIPDGVTLPSIKFPIKLKKTLIGSTSNVASCVFGAAADPSTGNGSLIPMGPNYIAGFSGVVSSTNPLGIFVPCTNFTYFDWSSSGGIPARFSLVRLVSAVVSVSVTPGIEDSAGVIHGCFLPKNQFNEWRGISVTTADDVMNLPQVQSVAINSGLTMSIRYRPADNECWAYCSTNYPLPIPTTDGIYFPGTFVVCGTGFDNNVEMTVQIQLNMEGIPRFSQNAKEATASYYDPAALDHAANLVANMPCVTTDPRVAIPLSDEGYTSTDSQDTRNDKGRLSNIAKHTITSKLVAGLDAPTVDPLVDGAVSKLVPEDIIDPQKAD